MKANKSKTTYIYCKFLKDCMCSYFYCPNCIENPFREEPDIDQELMDDLDSCSFDYDGHKVMFTKAAYNICNRIKTFDNKLNNNNMETITIELGGRKYKVSPVEEELTTIDQCVFGNKWSFDIYGNLKTPTCKGILFGAYPTESIAEKVLLYGLLQSVAHKLNRGLNGNWIIVNRCSNLVPFITADDSKTHANPTFATKQLAEQAISIFANSKFDLKKLYQ